jgi:hypothetical protein
MEIFQDTNYCYSQINEAWELFHQKSLKKEQIKVLKRVLMFIVLYNREAAQTAQVTLNEAILREKYFISKELFN